MKARHTDRDLERIERDVEFSGDRSEAVVQAFRKRMQQIRAATSEQDLRALKSLHFEKLKGKRAHQYSIRLNRIQRLVFELEGEAPDKVVVVVSVEDYH